MDLLYDIIVVIIILTTGLLLTLNQRKKLLRKWKEVTSKEIVFHRLLRETIQLFYVQKDLLRTEDNRLQFIRLGRSRKKKMRYLLLKERQELYLALSDIYNDIEEDESASAMELKKQFRKLQRARRIYNSKVLVYNQSISIFPTRYLAMKMNLKIKEYFG
jgi:hypothetical protein